VFLRGIIIKMPTSVDQLSSGCKHPYKADSLGMYC